MISHLYFFPLWSSYMYTLPIFLLHHFLSSWCFKGGNSLLDTLQAFSALHLLSLCSQYLLLLRSKSGFDVWRYTEDLQICRICLYWLWNVLQWKSFKFLWFLSSLSGAGGFLPCFLSALALCVGLAQLHLTWGEGNREEKIFTIRSDHCEHLWNSGYFLRGKLQCGTPPGLKQISIVTVQIGKCLWSQKPYCFNISTAAKFHCIQPPILLLVLKQLI